RMLRVVVIPGNVVAFDKREKGVRVAFESRPQFARRERLQLRAAYGSVELCDGFPVLPKKPRSQAVPVDRRHDGLQQGGKLLRQHPQLLVERLLAYALVQIPKQMDQAFLPGATYGSVSGEEIGHEHAFEVAQKPLRRLSLPGGGPDVDDLL